MEKIGEKIYGIMGLIGEILAVVGLYIGISSGILHKLNFSFLLFGFFSLLIIGIVLFEMKRCGKFESISMLNATIAKGHIAMMIGVCEIITAIISKNNMLFSDTLIWIMLVVIFFSFMMYIMIMLFSKISGMVKESEKK